MLIATSRRASPATLMRTTHSPVGLKGAERKYASATTSAGRPSQAAGPASQSL